MSVPSPGENVSCSRKECIWAFLAGSALLFVFFAPYLCTGSLIYSGDFGSSDLLELNIPRRMLTAQTLCRGGLPLWEPKLSNGLPLLAEGQAAVFNPFSLLPFLLFSPTLAADLSIIITVLIAFTGTYWLIRQYGLHPLAAFLGAAAYSLGGVFIFHLHHLNLTHSIAYLPYILVMLRSYAYSLKRKKPVMRQLAGLGAVMLLQILTGHPHMTYLSWLAAAVFIISSLWGESGYVPAAVSTNEATAAPEQRSNLHVIVTACGQLLAIGIISALLCSVQLLPTFELSQLSSRAQPYTWDALKESPFTIKDLCHLAAPYCFGSPAEGTYQRTSLEQGIFWENTAYIGLIPLILALASLLDLRRRPIAWLWGLAVFFLLAALGPQGYVYGIFWKLCPGFNLFRCPARFLFAFSLMLALLSAFGCQRLLQNLSQRFGCRRAAALTAVLVLLTCADLACVNYQYSTPLPSSWAQVPATAGYLNSNSKIYTPTYCYSWQDMIGTPGWRGNAQAVLAHRDLLSQDLSAVWGVHQHSDSNVLDGGLAVQAYRQLQMYQLNQLLSGVDSRGTIAVNADLLASLNRQGVTHILSYHQIRNAAELAVLDAEQRFINPQFPERPLYIYAFREPLGRVHWTPSLNPEPSAYIKRMQSMFNIEDNGSLYEDGSSEARNLGSAAITAEGANFLTVECHGVQPGALIIANVYYPGWQAFLDGGREVPIQRVNHAYQAVSLPAGQHTVVLQYSPQSFARGWKISLVTVLCLFIGGCFLHIRSVYRQRSGDSPRGTNNYILGIQKHYENGN